MKKSLVKQYIKGGIKTFRIIKALVETLSLLTLDFLAKLWALASLSYFLMALARRLT